MKRMIISVINKNTSPNETPNVMHADVVIVGAGIVGLAHAARSIDAGLSVLVIDRDHQAVGASVRNFGHCCITAQSGELYELAQAGRPMWLDYAERAGFWAVESGALVVATTPTELQVLRELSAQRAPGQITLLTASQVAHELGRSETLGLLGGAMLRDDLRVDPRTTAAKLAGWIDSMPQASVRWSTSALGFGAGEQRRARVETNRGAIEADQVFVCVGHDVDYLFPNLAEEHQIKRCALQMARSESPAGLNLEPAVLTATSMLRYEAFTEVPSAQKLRSEVRSKHQNLLDIQANVMFTQRPDGTLLLGDSHTYEMTHPPFIHEDISNTLLSSIEAVLHREPLKILERWQGVYASSEVGPLLIRNVAEAITVVSVTAGVGMTLSFGLADRNVRSLIQEPALSTPSK